HVAGLLARQELRRALPLAERHVTEHGDRRCGQDDRQQREHGKTTQSPSAFLVEETSDEGLRLLVGALADVMEADHATAVHEDPRRPGPARVPAPPAELVALP